MENVARIKEKCVGFKSCEQSCPKHCISMVENKEGFWYPSVDEKSCIASDAEDKVPDPGDAEYCTITHPDGNTRKISRGDLFTHAVQGTDWSNAEILEAWDILREKSITEKIRDVLKYVDGTIKNLRKSRKHKQNGEQKWKSTKKSTTKTEKKESSDERSKSLESDTPMQSLATLISQDPMLRRLYNS